jgi:hypothetical protein
MAGNRDSFRAWMVAKAKVFLDWCSDDRLQPLVAIGLEPGVNTVNTLWSRAPMDIEFSYVKSFFPDFYGLSSAVCGGFVSPLTGTTPGAPPQSGQNGNLSAGDEVAGFISKAGEYLQPHSLGGLFEHTNRTRYLFTAGHALWGSDLLAWFNQGNRIRVGPVSKLSPPSFPNHKDELTEDVGLVTVDEVGLQGWATPWAFPTKKLRKCGASTDCTHTKDSPALYCVKVPYAQGVCVTLVDQWIVKEPGFAVPGDSGALVQQKVGNRIEDVGMVVAVSYDREYTVVTPWETVLKAVGLRSADLTRLT